MPGMGGWIPYEQTLPHVDPIERQHAVAAYEQPSVSPGMPILWYPHPGAVPVLAQIAPGRNRSNKMARVMIPSMDREVTACPHMTHPDVGFGRVEPETGCWDFTDDHKHMKHWLDKVEERLADLERKMDVPVDEEVDAAFDLPVGRALPAHEEEEKPKSLRSKRTAKAAG